MIDRTLEASADAGWITAGGFLLELARLQELYGTVAAHLLPTTEAPILAQSDAMHPHLMDALSSTPGMVGFSSDELAPVIAFYKQIGQTVQLARGWLYDRQLADLPLTLADPFDLRDELTVASDPASASALFGRVLSDAAIANGVWNAHVESSSALAVDSNKPVLALPSVMQNPVTSLAEFGQRQAALGNYLFAIAGPDVVPAGNAGACAFDGRRGARLYGERFCADVPGAFAAVHPFLCRDSGVAVERV